jgi:hypothetical protein
MVNPRSHWRLAQDRAIKGPKAPELLSVRSPGNRLHAWSETDDDTYEGSATAMSDEPKRLSISDAICGNDRPI